MGLRCDRTGGAAGAYVASGLRRIILLCRAAGNAGAHAECHSEPSAKPARSEIAVVAERAGRIRAAHVSSAICTNDKHAMSP